MKTLLFQPQQWMWGRTTSPWTKVLTQWDASRDPTLSKATLALCLIRALNMHLSLPRSCQWPSQWWRKEGVNRTKRRMKLLRGLQTHWRHPLWAYLVIVQKWTSQCLFHSFQQQTRWRVQVKKCALLSKSTTTSVTFLNSSLQCKRQVLLIWKSQKGYVQKVLSWWLAMLSESKKHQKA